MGTDSPDIFLSGSRMGKEPAAFWPYCTIVVGSTKGNFFDDREYYDFGGGSGGVRGGGRLEQRWQTGCRSDQQDPGQGCGLLPRKVRRLDNASVRRSHPEVSVLTLSPKRISTQDGFVDLITGVANDIGGKSVFLIYNLGSSFDMSPPDYFQGAPISLSDLHYTDISRDGKSDFTLLYSRSIPMGTELKTIDAVQSFVGQPDGSLLGTGENLIQGIGGRAAIG